jgi:predicted regulator of Ras-like GTPase activity (Roadblock/LC7/MglB family)
MAWFWLGSEMLKQEAASNMFKFVKKWVRKWAEESPTDESVPAESESGSSENFPPEPPAAHEEYREHQEYRYGGAAASVPADVLELPLTAVYAALPQDLQARVRLPIDPRSSVLVPLAVIIPQLNRGSVKISFGELRELAQPNSFYSQIDRDQAIVELPLSEIFARINPSILSRRRQKAVEVPEEIESPFSGQGEGLKIYKPETTAFTRKHHEDFSAASEFPTRGHITSVPPNPTHSVPPPEPFAPATAPIPMPSAPAPIRRSVAPPTRELVQAAAQSPAAANGAVLNVRLVALAENWPPTVRTDMAEMNLLETSVALPLSLVEEALKKGKAVFSWMQVRQWTNSPAVAAGRISVHDTVLLELPLKVLAPLFLTQRLASKTRQKTAVDESIPDLFNSSKGSASAAKGNTERFTAAQNPPAEPPAARGNTDRFTAPKPADVPPREVFKEIIHQSGKARNSDTIPSGTDFLRRYATPNDIVGKALGLEGVAGALITLPDGLLVASQLPPALNPDALAGFLPQAFVRLSQSAREYRVGDLKDVAFTAGETPWHIFKVGSIFFGVFGRAGVALPTAELAALAAELDRKPKTI